MLDLSASNNVLEIQDGISGDVHEIYYRMPTNQERTAYNAQLWKRQGRKMVNQTYETRMKFGRRVVTGFRKGTFGWEGKAFASDPADSAYRSDWLDLLCSKRGDIIAAVAHAVFERTGTAADPNLFEMEDVDLEDDAEPDGDASGGTGTADPLE